MTQVSTAGQAGGGDGRSPGNRDRVRFDINRQFAIDELQLNEREDRRLGDGLGRMGPRKSSRTSWLPWHRFTAEPYHRELPGQGHNMDTALTAAVSGGSPPAVALVPDPGTLDALAKQGADQGPHEHPRHPDVQLRQCVDTLASYNGKQYGVVVQGANKNTIWYNPALFTGSGHLVATDHLGAAAHRRGTVEGGRYPRRSRSAPTSAGRSPDMWQNVYLKTAGAAGLQQAGYARSQVDRSDGTTAFSTLGQLFSQPSYRSVACRIAFPMHIPHASTRSSRSHQQCRRRPWWSRPTSWSARSLQLSNYAPGTTGTGGAHADCRRLEDPLLRLLPIPRRRGR